jgi:SPX domain protein involved in polyphosphate accumulation
MKGFETRFERLELKFVVDESKAQRVRQALEPYCRADEHNVTGLAAGLPGYGIRSLYLDTPSLEFFRSKERGDPTRMKLRVRKYQGPGPLSLELKHKTAQVIQKTRVMIDHAGVEQSARGRGKLWEETPEGRHFAQHFAYLVASSGAEPALLVAYNREAYTSTVDDYARVTMDREIAAQRADGWDLDGDPERWCEVRHFLAPSAPKPLVVLELKCRSLVPHWITELIRRHELRIQSFSKYSIGIQITGRALGTASLTRRCGRILR